MFMIFIISLQKNFVFLPYVPFFYFIENWTVKNNFIPLLCLLVILCLLLSIVKLNITSQEDFFCLQIKVASLDFATKDMLFIYVCKDSNKK